MDDLISELHEWTQDLDIQDCGADGVLFRAIARIEQLEEALREICELPSVRMDESGIIARAALGEKLTPTKTPLMELIEKKMNDGEPPVDWSK